MKARSDQVQAFPRVTRKQSTGWLLYFLSCAGAAHDSRRNSGVTCIIAGGWVEFSIKICSKRCQVVQTLPGITVTAARLWQFSILPRSQSTPALNDSAATRLGLEKSSGLMDFSLSLFFSNFCNRKVSNYLYSSI